MKKKILSVLISAAMVAVLVTGCGGSSEEVAEEAVETEATADGEMVSDETFAALQENFAVMKEAYDAVAELYNSDEVAADEDIEATMADAADVIEQMGQITQESITEEDAESLNSAMLDILEALQLTIDSMS